MKMNKNFSFMRINFSLINIASLNNHFWKKIVQYSSKENYTESFIKLYSVLWGISTHIFI